MRHELDSQKKLNMEEFEEDDVEAQRRYAGVRPGAYCRVKLSAVPCEFVKVLTQFTRFTRAKVQVLTAEELVGRALRAVKHFAPHFACFTGPKVQIRRA